MHAILKNHRLLLGLILIFGLFLRTVDINNNPPALYGDELTLALDANSILHTAHDQLGNFLPITFKMSDSRPAGYVYFSVPFLALFGPTPLGVRALSILSGTGVIWLVYLITSKLRNSRAGLIAALLMSISPWSITLSRAGFETHFALFLALASIYSLVQVRDKAWWAVLAVVFAGLAVNTYSTYKLTMPLLGGLMIWYLRLYQLKFIRQNIKAFLVSGVIALVVVILWVVQAVGFGSESRFANLNVLNDPDVVKSVGLKVDQERRSSELPSKITNVFENRPVEVLNLLTKSYLANFSPDYLLVSGDQNPRHNPAGFGAVYLIDGLLILVGLGYLLTHDRRLFWMLVGWLLIAPMAATLLLDPHFLRNSLMLPVLLILSSIGVYALTKKIGGSWRLMVLFLSVVYISCVSFFGFRYYFLSPKLYANFWSYGAKIAVDQAISAKSNGRVVVLSDRIDNMEYAYPVYAQVDPIQVINQNQSPTIWEGIKSKKYDNVLIASIPATEVERRLAQIRRPLIYIGPIDDKVSLEGYETVDGLDRKPLLVIKKYN